MFGATLTMQEVAKRDKRRTYHRVYCRSYRERNGERRRALDRVRAALTVRDPAQWPKHIVKVAKDRAKKTGIEFTISAKDVVLPDVCPVLGTPFVFGEMRHPHGPSIDRVSPVRGYVPDNVRVISLKANRAKNDITDPELFRRLALYIEGKI